jgi:hypothetical protein
VRWAAFRHCLCDGLFKVRMLVIVARPVMFWMRPMLRPAVAASR